MSLLDRLLRRTSRAYVQVMGGGLAGDFRQDAYRNAVVRETVDAIARHAAKISAVHMRNGQRVDDRMQYIIGTRPNPWMSAYDYQYKMFSTALLKNNAFALQVWDYKGEFKAILPIDYTSCEAVEDEHGSGLYIHFQLKNGKETLLPYDELYHIRRHFSQNIVLGDGNDPLDNAVEMVNIANAGMMSAVKSGSSLRGLLKVKQAMLKDRDARQRRDDFVRDYIDAENNGGVAALDVSMDYVQLDPSKMYNLSTEQMAEIRGNVYRYYGVSEKFVRGDYDENEWNAAYEAAIEPFIIQSHMEYTQKTFTEAERAARESIEFEANRLQYASTQTKIDLVNRLGMLGLITYNEGRAIFTLPPIPGGDRLIPPWNAEGDPNVIKTLEPGGKEGKNAE